MKYNNEPKNKSLPRDWGLKMEMQKRGLGPRICHFMHLSLLA